MKFLIDMNMQRRWVDYLQRFEFASTHWSDIGAADEADVVILEYARQHGFVVLTQDLDFGIALALTRASAPSVIQIRNKDVRPETMGGVVALAARNLQEELARGALLTIKHNQVRLRLLPLLERLIPPPA